MKRITQMGCFATFVFLILFGGSDLVSSNQALGQPPNITPGSTPELAPPDTTLLDDTDITDKKPSKTSRQNDSKTSGLTEVERKKIASYLDNVEFVGRFTTDGSEGQPAAERYHIKSCVPGNKPELFNMTVRIQYGGRDVEVPLVVRIVMADQTPVITVDKLWIPGMGTFDARVLIRRDRYAGTWLHDDHGGFLYGKIEKYKSPDAEK